MQVLAFGLYFIVENELMYMNCNVKCDNNANISLICLLSYERSGLNIQLFNESFFGKDQGRRNSHQGINFSAVKTKIAFAFSRGQHC